MFGILAALSSLTARDHGRHALHYENYIRTGQEPPATKIYSETSAEKQARHELAAVRRKERLEQQVKFVRLMKKLLVRADQDVADGGIDDELEQMRTKVAQIELKVGRAARHEDVNCEAMLNPDTPDDADDIELEDMIRTASANQATTETSTTYTDEDLKGCDRACGDHIDILSSSASASRSSDECLVERIRKTDAK